MDIVLAEHGLCEPCRRLLQDGHRDHEESERAEYSKIASKIVYKQLKWASVQSKWTIDHHENFPACLKSAAQGCHICALLISQRTSDERQELSRSEWMKGSAEMDYGSFHKKHPKHGVEAEIRVWYDINDWTTWYRSWSPDHDSSESPVFRNKTMSLQIWSTTDEPCSISNGPVDVAVRWDLVAAWVSACLHGHKTCVSGPGRNTGRPMRLIQVGDHADLSDVRICMDVPADELYITLSHCWGPDGIPIMLLKSNYQDYLQNLPWNELPKTFRDAISVVRALRPRIGVQYLWIDALCIIQDSEDDKNAEISRMSGIYQNGLCNLATSIGSNCHSGLMAENHFVPPHECVVESGTLGKHSQRIKIGNRNNYDILVQRSDLSKRAWVLQEVVLAPRVLFFTPEQLVWECSEACYYEATGLLERQREFEVRIKYLPIHRLESLSGPRDIWEIYNFWGRCLQDFSQRQLSFGSDKLRAIAAIAEVIEGQLGRSNRYLAGLWSEDLHLHLQWEVKRPTKFSHSDRTKSAFPSWSWASLDTPIEPESFDWDTLRTSRACMKIQPNIHHADGMSRFDMPTVASIDFTGTVFKVDIWIDTNPPKNMRRLDYEILDKECELEKQVHSAYLIFISVRNAADGIRKYGLLLLRVPGQRGHYYRIGSCIASQNDLIYENWNDHVLIEDDYVELVEEHSYRITVI